MFLKRKDLYGEGYETYYATDQDYVLLYKKERERERETEH